MKWSIVRVDRKTKEKSQISTVGYSRKTDIQRIISILQNICGYRYLYYVIQVLGH